MQQFIKLENMHLNSFGFLLQDLGKVQTFKLKFKLNEISVRVF